LTNARTAVSSIPVTEAPRRGAQADRDGDRLLVVEQQRRQGGPGAQPVAAGRPGQRVDGIAQRAQPLDIAADRPAGHRQPVGQLGPGPVAARLEQGEQLQEPARGLRHGASSFSQVEDRS
jgi:hypothetical protein